MGMLRSPKHCPDSDKLQFLRVVNSIDALDQLVPGYCGCLRQLMPAHVSPLSPSDALGSLWVLDRTKPIGVGGAQVWHTTTIQVEFRICTDTHAVLRLELHLFQHPRFLCALALTSWGPYNVVESNFWCPGHSMARDHPWLLPEFNSAGLGPTEADSNPESRSLHQPTQPKTKETTNSTKITTTLMPKPSSANCQP